MPSSPRARSAQVQPFCRNLSRFRISRKKSAKSSVLSPPQPPKQRPHPSQSRNRPRAKLRLPMEPRAPPPGHDTSSSHAIERYFTLDDLCLARQEETRQPVFFTETLLYNRG